MGRCWDLLGCLEPLRGPPGELLGCSWNVARFCGLSWGPLGANFENLYGEEGAPGALLGRSWKPKQPQSSPNTTVIVEFWFSGSGEHPSEATSHAISYSWKPRKAKKNEEADEANFDEPLGIFCGPEKSRTDFGRSGATPVDVSAHLLGHSWDALGSQNDQKAPQTLRL